jgi:DNA-binding LacI/PurR family transcriptional regulator
MVEYLCRSGKAPVFLTMPKLNSNAVERRDAYFAKMREIGHTGDVIPTPDGMDSWEFERYGFEVMDAHFGQGRFVGATILCANDRIAIGAVRAANTHGLFSRNGGVSGELRIAGHDDHPLSRYIYPALTTVAQQVDDIGKVAVNLLTDRVRNGRDGSAVTRLLDGALKVRESA